MAMTNQSTPSSTPSKPTTQLPSPRVPFPQSSPGRPKPTRPPFRPLPLQIPALTLHPANSQTLLLQHKIIRSPPLQRQQIPRPYPSQRIQIKPQTSFEYARLIA